MSGNQEPSDVSVYDRLRRSDEQLLAWLANGSHPREVAGVIGDAEYELLAPLARLAAAAQSDRTTRVLLVPGIMGSLLGRPRPAPWPADLIWIDPVDVMSGRLFELRLPELRPMVALGTIAFTYFSLKLRLEARGLPVTLYNYDWRLDIASQGRRLAQHIAQMRESRIYLVAHSMGGLVARAALHYRDDNRIHAVVTLGTPHTGTFAPVQALRATYPTVRRLAALDRRHDAEQLATQVFGTFPSLYDMLPQPGALTTLELHAAATWPASGPQPDLRLLAAARHFGSQLAAADARFHSIAGVGVRTVTALRLAHDEFIYQVDSMGDGTVPLKSALQSNSAHYYSHSEHSELPRSAVVAESIAELLRNGVTSGLVTTAPSAAADGVEVSDRELRATYVDKVDWRQLNTQQRALYLNQLNLAPPQYAARTVSPL